MPEAVEMTAYAATLLITAPEPLPDDRWREAISEFFTRLGALFKGQNGVTIGHIKGFLRLAGGSCAYLSTVGTSAGASCRFEKGSETSLSRQGDLDFNVILLGLTEDQVAALLPPEVERLAQTLGANCQLKKAVPPTKGGFRKK